MRSIERFPFFSVRRVNLLRSASLPDNALSRAVTFGYPDVVRALASAGSSTGVVESSGINLLHWAAITNRASLIPLLAQARVPINATDDYGFTPLNVRRND